MDTYMPTAIIRALCPGWIAWDWMAGRMNVHAEPLRRTLHSAPLSRQLMDAHAKQPGRILHGVTLRRQTMDAHVKLLRRILHGVTLSRQRMDAQLIVILCQGRITWCWMNALAKGGDLQGVQLRGRRRSLMTSASHTAARRFRRH